MRNDLLLKALQLYARRFPVNKGKRRVIKRVSRLFLSDSKPRVALLRFNGLKMQCDLSKHIQRELFFFGAYEVEECKLWMRMAREASIIFDVGANVGLYSLLAAYTNPNAEVHAFEPTPALSDAIGKNVRLNGLGNIRINRLAASNVSGEAFLNYCDGSDGANEGMNFVTKAGLQNHGEPTTAITLDDYCRENAIYSVDLMKMDIEGGEYAALLGAQQMLKHQAIGCILLELVEWAANRSGCSTEDVKRVLVENGYQIHAVHAGSTSSRVLEDAHYEGNAIAIPKGNHRCL